VIVPALIACQLVNRLSRTGPPLIVDGLLVPAGFFLGVSALDVGQSFMDISPAVRLDFMVCLSFLA